jgi:CBS domain-containing protein
VIDDEEKCIGIFTERDAIRLIANLSLPMSRWVKA